MHNVIGMALNWQHGYCDRQDPQQPTNSPLGSGMSWVQPVMPEQYCIASSSSLQGQGAGQGQSAAPASDDWHHLAHPDDCQPQEAAGQQVAEVADVVWPEDLGVCAQWAGQAPKNAFALDTGGAKAFVDFWKSVIELASQDMYAN